MNFNRMSSIPYAVAGLALTLGLGCSGSKHSDPTPTPAATGLTYADPTGTGWRLVKGSASTATHLVLELKAPAASQGLGMGLNLTLDSRASWSKVAAADPTFIKNGAYELGTDARSQMLKALVRGTELQTGIYQKGIASPVTYTGTVLSVAIDFKAATGLMADTVLPLAVAKITHIGGDGSVVDLTSQVAVGTLKTQ